jgi:hypothetical protein
MNHRLMIFLFVMTSLVCLLVGFWWMVLHFLAFSVVDRFVGLAVVTAGWYIVTLLAVVDTEIVNHLSPEERARMDRIREKFEGLAWKRPDRVGREQRKSSRKADMETVYSSLLAGVAEGGPEVKVRAMKERLNRLYGKAGEAG